MNSLFGELKESESNLISLINNRDEAIWSIDTNFNYIIFNNFFKEAYLKTFNIELKKGVNALEILTPELLEFWTPKYTKALAGERITFEYTQQVESKKYFYEVYLNPIISDGQITGVSCLSIDITDRKIVENALLESKANVSAIIENTTDSIWAINSSYDITYVNAVFATAFETSFGTHLEPGVNLLESLPEQIRDMWKSRYDKALSNERFSIVDKIDLENLSIYIEVLLNPIVVDDKVVGVSFFGRDVTERKQVEEDIRRQNEELTDLNKTKDKFFSI
ncbi:MAG: PAS domain-containing protein, partial [Melioribacteraceae bacterium]|nr:PAS domain-containing protein [Melioribacteraceae bacterium]